MLRQNRKLVRIRKLTVPQKMDDFLERGLAREFVDVIPRVNELSDVPEHVGEAGGVGNDSFESFCGNGHGCMILKEVFV